MEQLNPRNKNTRDYWGESNGIKQWPLEQQKPWLLTQSLYTYHWLILSLTGLVTYSA